MSQQRTKYDLTSGGILDKLLLVAVPVMGTQLMQMSYNLTDMFWLGRVDADAVAASGTAGMFMWLSMAFVMIGRMGAEIGVAQSLGRGDREGALGFAQNALFLAALLGALYGLALMAFNRPLVGFFGIREARVEANTRAYLGVVALGMPAAFIASALAGTFNASGNSRTPFLVNGLGLLLNMILDPLAIFGLGMGVMGAAVATVVSQYAVFILMTLAARLHRSRPFETFPFFVRPNLPRIRRILAWSVPLGLESAFFTSMAMVTSRFIAGFGAPAMAVSRVGSQIESLSWLIGGGYGSALTAFMGQNFGGGKWTRIREGFRISAWVMLLWGIFITGLIFLGAGFLFSLFLPDPELLPMGVTYLRIVAACQIPQCFEAIAGSTFKGIGRTLPPSLVSVGANVTRVILAFVFSRTALGLTGIWVGITVAAVLRGCASFFWYLLAARKHPREDEPGVAAAGESA